MFMTKSYAILSCTPSEVENHLRNLNIHKSKGMRTETIYIAPVHKKEPIKT